MKICNGLSLDQYASTEVIVTRQQCGLLYLHAKGAQLVGDAARELEDVHSHSAHLRDRRRHHT
jgi:hypothetical protein